MFVLLNKLIGWEITGFIFVVIIGSLLHFVYNWTGNNRIAGIFSPINESTWEHLKLLFVPMLLFSAFEYFNVGKNYPNFILAKSIGIVLGLITIIITFYTYTGIIGKHFLCADILTFIFGVAVAFTYSWQAIHHIQINIQNQFAGIILILTLAVSFLLFTFYPPHIALFLDPVTKGYGISGNQ